MMAVEQGLRDSLTLPAFAAPMCLCRGVDLAIASCKAGIIGSLTRNHCRDLEELEAQLKAVHEALANFSDRPPDRKVGPLAVNISTTFSTEEFQEHLKVCARSGTRNIVTSVGSHPKTAPVDRTAGLLHFSARHPDRKVGPLAVNISPTFSTEEFQEHLKVCARYGTRIIVTSVGDPTKNAPVVRDAGLLHFHDATTIRFAEKAAAANVDGIVCIGAGGGGRAGTVSHLAFVPIVRSMFDGTIVLAGAVSTGAVIRAAEILGADRSEEHTSELQSLMRISYAGVCLKKKNS